MGYCRWTRTALTPRVFIIIGYNPLSCCPAVHCRPPPRRHPRRGAGSRADLRPGGRSHVVRVQEERFALPPASRARQRLLQTDPLAGRGVGRERADRTPGGSLGGVALSDGFRGLFYSPVICRPLAIFAVGYERRPTARSVTAPRDGGETRWRQTFPFFVI